jgi:hypothetical protein
MRALSHARPSRQGPKPAHSPRHRTATSRTRPGSLRSRAYAQPDKCRRRGEFTDAGARDSSTPNTPPCSWPGPRPGRPGTGAEIIAVARRPMASVDSPVVGSSCCPGPRRLITFAVCGYRRDAREPVMLGFSQIIRPRASVAPARPVTGAPTATTSPPPGGGRPTCHGSSGQSDDRPHPVWPSQPPGPRLPPECGSSRSPCLTWISASATSTVRQLSPCAVSLAWRRPQASRPA